jgi:hypothetical protein
MSCVPPEPIPPSPRLTTEYTKEKNNPFLPLFSVVCIRFLEKNTNWRKKKSNRADPDASCPYENVDSTSACMLLMLVCISSAGFLPIQTIIKGNLM